MKKTFTFLFLALIIFFEAKSQTIGNEWITYGQPYVKMTVDTKGIYRIFKSNLQASDE